MYQFSPFLLLSEYYICTLLGILTIVNNELCPVCLLFSSFVMTFHRLFTYSKFIIFNIILCSLPLCFFVLHLCTLAEVSVFEKGLHPSECCHLRFAPSLVTDMRTSNTLHLHRVLVWRSNYLVQTRQALPYSSLSPAPVGTECISAERRV